MSVFIQSYLAYFLLLTYMQWYLNIHTKLYSYPADDKRLLLLTASLGFKQVFGTETQ